MAKSFYIYSADESQRLYQQLGRALEKQSLTLVNQLEYANTLRGLP